MKKRSISLILNLLIISFELVGFIFSYLYNHRIAIEFYTECSNILMLVCSMVFVYYMVYNKSIPKWLHYFKYLSTTCVSITFFVVLFILIPMGNFDYYAFLFNGTLLFHHTLCPILAIITFLFFDNLKVWYSIGGNAYQWYGTEVGNGNLSIYVNTADGFSAKIFYNPKCARNSKEIALSNCINSECPSYAVDEACINVIYDMNSGKDEI